MKLVPGQDRYQLAYFFLRRIVLIGRAVEMNKNHSAAALHHPIGRNGRIDTAGN